MIWKDFVYSQVLKHCNETESRTFSLQELLKAKLPIFQSFRPDNRNVEAKVRQQLQFLRNDNLISFLGNSGNYTLRAVEILDAEKKELSRIDLTNELPEKKEYLIETYVRKVKWAKQAIEMLGYYCLFDECKNTFVSDEGKPYIEVHHVIPLCKGGENKLWNLAVLCAHHHRMAHFADFKTRNSIEKFLLTEIKNRTQ